jgi:hypothetical protein
MAPINGVAAGVEERIRASRACAHDTTEADAFRIPVKTAGTPAGPDLSSTAACSA